jgi:hypothetical protein
MQALADVCAIDAGDQPIASNRVARVARTNKVMSGNTCYGKKAIA